MQSLWLATIGLLLMTTGCTRYQFNLVQPADRATTITAKSDAHVAIAPLEYVLRASEGRLVMRIHNPTDESVQLLGVESAVVDPDGQSHPLPSMTILPQSHGRLILPPMRPRFRDTNPNIGFGVGIGVSGVDSHDPHAAARLRHAASEPRYFDIYSASDPIYWDWRGEGRARLLLVYDQSGQRIRHELVFDRVKAK